MGEYKYKGSKYQEAQRTHQKNLIENSNIFDGAKAGAIYKQQPRDFVLLDGRNNLFSEIRQSVIEYFKTNNITWWGGRISGHVLSSQIACLNHLFPLRNNPEILKNILNNVTNMNFEEVLPIPEWLDKQNDGSKHYVSFEVISYKDNLNETTEGKELTRGSNCTSIDALIIAKDPKKEVWIIPIEWKYTEFYQNMDKSQEDREGETKGENGKGKERMKRYCNLITQSTQLQTLNDYQGSIYFQEPFYQLMRQTLWAEQVLANEADRWYGVKNYLHLHIVPSANLDLLCKNYKRFPSMTNGMETEWRNHLLNKNLYKIIDPKNFVKPIKQNYPELYSYLETRYWQ